MSENCPWIIYLKSAEQKEEEAKKWGLNVSESHFSYSKTVSFQGLNPIWYFNK